MDKEKTTFQVRDLRNRLNRALKKKQELNNIIIKALKYIKSRNAILGDKTLQEILLGIEDSDKE